MKRLLFLMLAISSLSARALSNKGMVPLVTFGSGAFNVMRDEMSAPFQIEYRSAYSIAMARPFIGAFTTTKNNFYLFAGIGWDLHFSKKIVLTPSFAPGVYLKGRDKDLGYPLEFRTCLDLAYKFENKGRMGVQFYHLSNASIGVKNPGEESLIFYYAKPLN